MIKVLEWRKAIQASALSSTTRHVLLNLSIYMDASGFCFPSVRQQAIDTGLSERAVCEHLKKATAAGMINKTIHGSPGRSWKRHEYRAILSQGADPKSVPQVRAVDFNSGEALIQSQSNSPIEEKEDKRGYFWQRGIIKIDEACFRKWQSLSSLTEDGLDAVLSSRADWLDSQPDAKRKAWFISTQKFLQRYPQRNRVEG